MLTAGRKAVANVNAEPVRTQVVILGAGPAGLTAAYELSKHGISTIALERDDIVGGLAKTVNYKDYLFDLGGHRFYTKVALVEKIWHEVLGEDFLTRPRLSRIYYRSRFFHYPLDAVDVLRGIGPTEILRCGGSFLKARMFPQAPEDNFATWVSNRFGRRLFHLFFETYTEKVWGMPCHKISADWAAQRIRGLSLSTLVRDALSSRRNRAKKNTVKSLIKEFHYPRRGPGMMWTRMQQLIEQRGSKVILNAPVERICWDDGRITSVQAGQRTYVADHFISSLAIRDLLNLLVPRPSQVLCRAAFDFNYRDFITVGLVVRGKNLFPDNWLYIHEPAVKVGRIQNYTNWSPEMSPDPDTSSLGLEYFCFQGDRLWCKSNQDLVNLATRELVQLGLVKAEDVLDGTVMRVPKAYPVYDDTYPHGLAAVQELLQAVPNLQLVGRNGMHRYNNQDHSMLTALLAARNILGANFDLWRMNADADYLEEGFSVTEDDLTALESTQPRTPMRV